MNHADASQTQVNVTRVHAWHRCVQIPSQIIRNDLLVTGSVEATTERILDGRSVGPGNQILRDLPQTGLPQMPRSPGGVSIRTFPTAPGRRFASDATYRPLCLFRFMFVCPSLLRRSK